MDLPFDGAITNYFETDFPKNLRALVEKAGKDPVLEAPYPHQLRMGRKAYKRDRSDLQIQLVRLQAWARETGARIVVVLEGRDAAGKGGTIKRFVENMNPRSARVVALPKPTDREQAQWYFQRYVEHMPTAGEIVFFDRSWYNRAVVERVFGFSSERERELFFEQVVPFERMMVRDGVRLFKIWLTVGRAEQMRRMRDREKDPLKQWKLSPIDIQSLGKWEAYTQAIREMFDRTHSETAPWMVILADDKRRARLAAQRSVLSALAFEGRSPEATAPPDPAIAGAPAEMRDAGVPV